MASRFTGHPLRWRQQRIAIYGCNVEPGIGENCLGQISDLAVQSLLQKDSCFHLTQITGLLRAVPCPMRGAFRDRHGRWVRDAVDADAQMTNSADRGRRSRVVLTPRRWRQVPEQQASGMTVTRKPITGEITKETVKTIACGNAG
jgi:hypothetical protein